MRRCGDGWVCSSCGHNLEIDKSLAMQIALTMMGDDGPCSAKSMSFAQTAVYIRRLELRWMQDQRRIRDLEREANALPAPFQERPAWPEDLVAIGRR